jgi:hypothetical protein
MSPAMHREDMAANDRRHGTKIGPASGLLSFAEVM